MEATNTYPNLKPWKPSQSGNPAEPPGTRHAFSQAFIRDFALVWQEEGLEAVRKVARRSPDTFVAIAAMVCPSDVRITLEQSLPGNLSPADWNLMLERGWSILLASVFIRSGKEYACCRNGRLLARGAGG